jgi:hypothetical protein
MTEKEDKFAIFSKKFAQLDGEGQDRLVTAAYELFRAHKCVKNISTNLLSSGIEAYIARDNFNDKKEHLC